MDSVTGAMGSLLLKLGKLAMDEYNLQKGVKRNVKALRGELESMQAALRKVGDVPSDQLDEQVELWARDVRELSYDADDVLDTFMVRVRVDDDNHGSKGMVNKVAAGFLGKAAKTRHDIADEIKGIMERAREDAARRDRYKVDAVVARFNNGAAAAAGGGCDPRLYGLYRDEAELVGIDEASDELINALATEAVVSVVGGGGLGKTTLARAFDCTAFDSVSSAPDMKKAFKDMLLELDKTKYKDIHNLVRDEKQLIDEIRDFVQNKRYLIVIDDIWDIASWSAIRCALVENNDGSTIIATTRDFDIAEQIGSPHKLKTLPPKSSKKLFYGRIFGSEDKCPQELVEVSGKILKKCGDVPLAIITIASVLARTRNMAEEWYKVYNSIGYGLGNNHDIKNMRKILSLSYHNLPSHLRTCLLYLSIFPEDYEIERSRLIRMWISEGFIHPEKDGDNMFELADNYFNELINRSLIQPSGYVSGMPHSCRVHDMIHDLIRSLSSKENFVTVLDGISQQTSPASKNNKLENSTAQTNMKMSQVLRVLDLENCYLTEGCHLDLRHVCNLFHLRYLRLYECNFDRELLKEIENLKFLQTLIVKREVRLPSTIAELRRLMFLHVHTDTILPKGMDNLTLLEELSLIDINKSPNFAKELRNLTKLRELELFWGEMNESLEEALIESLCNLQRIQNLQILPFGNSSLDFIGEHWMPSVYLQSFVATGSSRFTIVPAWIRKNPSLLTNLTNLSIKLQELRQEDLKTLGRLPALLNLRLYAGRSECLLTCVGEFCCLRSFNLRSRDSLRLTFHQGAMPRVQRVLLSFHVQDGNGDFDFGLENLLSLEHADVFLSQTTGTIDNDMEMERAKSALRHAALIHPNHPTLEIH
uniref:AAA+ ATPase domain-containing protein n=1 Tax=Oryza rufipogon TaxID=4529 RepID=A0A0E0QQA4_ORYRU